MKPSSAQICVCVTHKIAEHICCTRAQNMNMYTNIYSVQCTRYSEGDGICTYLWIHIFILIFIGRFFMRTNTMKCSQAPMNSIHLSKAMARRPYECIFIFFHITISYLKSLNEKPAAITEKSLHANNPISARSKMEKKYNIFHQILQAPPFYIVMCVCVRFFFCYVSA